MHTLETEICEVPLVHPETVSRVKDKLIDDDQSYRLADLFAAFSDQTRLRIIEALSIEEMCVCDLAATLGLSQSAASHQLRNLRQIRLVKQRKSGRLVYYSLDDHHIQSLFKMGLEHVLEEMPSRAEARP